MKLKFIHPEKPKWNKEKLYQLALREAVSQLILNGEYKNYSSAYNSVMSKAKSEYKKKKS